MKEVIQYLNTHYQEEITLTDLSERFYVSQYYLCREFKKYTGTTIVNYLNKNRIMDAQKLFLETDDNVTQVCHQTGFSNLTHFNRVFKDIAGMTPSQYRRKVKAIHEEATNINKAP